VTVALIYHDVALPAERDRVGLPGGPAARYKLDPEHFEAHLDALAATGLSAGLVGVDSAPPFALTFDDGGSSSLSIADSLERRGWRGHFFVITGRIGTPGFVDVDTVRELARRGHDVGSHSHSHLVMSGLGQEEIDEEWCRSRDILEEALGRRPTTAAVPGGHMSRAVVEGAARAGYRVLMTSEPVLEVRSVGELRVHGRYGVWASTPARTVAAYATGGQVALARLRASWRAKQVAKRLSPRAYGALRRARALIARR
jgi:peptidoglycan/xylan/chitin deacetylase (PgdA/CDA1 family)